MNIFSYGFFLLWGISLVLYYFVDNRWQWKILAISSVVFYVLSVDKFPGVLLIVWLTAFLGAKWIECNRTNRKGKLFFILAESMCVGALFFGRTTNIAALLGNSYFVLKAIGYIIDVYREDKSEKNPFKYLLYLVYWPTVLEGPFNRIKDFENNFNPKISFDYVNFTHGLQRFIWGVFKKLVIAERLRLAAIAILDAPWEKGGKYVILAIITYAIQLYADFSGFMDMMLGVSLTFGIRLPENFRQPYFSKSIPEFWRRWHITLGLWFRDYVMFPFSSWSVMKKLAKRIRKKNKAWGKLLPILSGTCLVWILTGLWHGFSINYFLWGIYYAILMCCSQIYNSFFVKEERNRGKRKKAADILAIARTVILVLIADSIICVQGLANVKILWQEILFNFNGGMNYNMTLAGFTKQDVLIVGIGVLVMFINSLIKETGGSVQQKLDEAPILVRWVVYYVLIFSILILGLYGSQYDASQFMYMQF